MPLALLNPLRESVPKTRIGSVYQFKLKFERNIVVVNVLVYCRAIQEHGGRRREEGRVGEGGGGGGGEGGERGRERERSTCT